MLDNETFDTNEFSNPQYIKGLSEILNEKSQSIENSNQKKNLKRINKKRKRLHKTSVDIETVSDDEEKTDDYKNASRISRKPKLLKEEIIAKSH